MQTIFTLFIVFYDLHLYSTYDLCLMEKLHISHSIRYHPYAVSITPKCPTVVCGYNLHDTPRYTIIILSVTFVLTNILPYIDRPQFDNEYHKNTFIDERIKMKSLARFAFWLITSIYKYVDLFSIYDYGYSKRPRQHGYNLQVTSKDVDLTLNLS